MDSPSRCEIADCILSLATSRGVGKTICPSEVARKLAPQNWRPLMPEIRIIVAQLLETGRVRVTQFGKNVDPLNPKGHIRIGIVDNESDSKS